MFDCGRIFRGTAFCSSSILSSLFETGIQISHGERIKEKWEMSWKIKSVYDWSSPHDQNWRWHTVKEAIKGIHKEIMQSDSWSVIISMLLNKTSFTDHNIIPAAFSIWITYRMNTNGYFNTAFHQNKCIFQFTCTKAKDSIFEKTTLPNVISPF